MAEVAAIADSLNASVKDAVAVGESAPPALRGMSRGRALILKCLCQAAWRRQRPRQALAAAVAQSPEASRLLEAMQFDADLKAELDTLLRRGTVDGHSRRVSLVERCLLKMALAELRGGGTPEQVVVSEAVKLAEMFGSDRSAGFVNALLRTHVQSKENTGAASLAASSYSHK